MKISLILFIVIALLAGTLLLINAGTAKRPLSSEIKRPIAVSDPADPFIQYAKECERAIAMNERLLAAYKEHLEETGPKAIRLFRGEAELLEQRNLELRMQLKEMKNKRIAFRRNLDSLNGSVAAAVKKNAGSL
ncbi:MAG: hypothetical protein KA247_01785 [Bacteroidetes bacterium]|nr:hypothetical protein [Bacteroidota bacterium]